MSNVTITEGTEARKLPFIRGCSVFLIRFLLNYTLKVVYEHIWEPFGPLYLAADARFARFPEEVDGRKA